MPIAPAEIPPHMLDAARTKTQKKAFARVKKAAEKSEPAKASEKPAPKK